MSWAVAQPFLKTESIPRPAASPLTLLADAHYDGLLAYVRAKVRSASLAADIVQESWLRAIVAMQEREIVNGRNYLYRTARNLLIDLQRQDRTRSAWIVDGVEAEDVACDTPSAERHVMARQELDHIMAIIVELPPRCQAVFVMRKFDEMTPAEIGSALGIRRGTVEKHLRLALIHLLTRMNVE